VFLPLSVGAVTLEPNTVDAPIEVIEPVVEPTPPPTPKELVFTTFGDAAPVMWEVFRCESGHNQFNGVGEPLRSPTNDWGFAQVNATVWDTTAKRLGLDYKHSLEDNLTMARYIYDVQGVRAWTCYKKVYGQPLTSR
jgi:hypothetical protein